jgi:type VI secretion system secreted protein VgrG
MGAAPSLFSGALVTLQKYPEDSQNKEYLVTHCTHDFEEADYRSGYAGSAGYVGNYELTPSDRQYRAPAVTRRPEIVGVQSALVVGSGEIDVDDDGRILVQFYWDRKKDNSRRVRVAQVWAGGKAGKRGALFTPRVGDEVLIQYEDGDPDRPIVVGSVYNGQYKVPMDLPSKKMKSGILTLSSTGGTGYNMLLFDDTAGSEKIKLRAQKDLMFKALNDEQRDIVHDQTENVGDKETINVGYPVGNNPPGAGEFTLNVLKKVTINVGPKGNPLTQLIMDTQSITLNVGPSGSLSQVVMDTKSLSSQSTQIKETGKATISNDAPMVKINCGG